MEPRPWEHLRCCTWKYLVDGPSEEQRVRQDNCKPAEVAAGSPAEGKQQLVLLRSGIRAVAVGSAWPYCAYPYCADEEGRPYGCEPSLGRAGGHRELRDVPPCRNVFQTPELSTKRFASRPKSGEVILFSMKEAATHMEVYFEGGEQG